MLAVLVVAISAPYASADSVTLDLSGSLTPDSGACSPSCTLGGDIVINNTTGTVTSVDFTVAGESPSVGPFNMFAEFVAGDSDLATTDSAINLFAMTLSGNPGTLVGYTGGAISGGFIGSLFIVNSGAALTETTPAPEPSSVALMLLGVGLVFVMRKRIGQGLRQAI
jgi:hypothetical protein